MKCKEFLAIVSAAANAQPLENWTLEPGSQLATIDLPPDKNDLQLRFWFKPATVGIYIKVEFLNSSQHTLFIPPILVQGESLDAFASLWVDILDEHHPCPNVEY